MSYEENWSVEYGYPANVPEFYTMRGLRKFMLDLMIILKHLSFNLQMGFKLLIMVIKLGPNIYGQYLAA